MKPLITRRQVMNRQCREMGLLPIDSYQPFVGPEDEVQITELRSEPRVHARQFSAVVLGVDDHGHYRLVHYRQTDSGTVGVARVNSDGVPPDWGVIAMRVTRRVHFRLEPNEKRRI